MKVVFIGGGSFRTLPIVRAAMAEPNVLTNGEISLVDLDLGRAETVGRLIARTPEYAGSNCRILWTSDLGEALPGADVVSVSFPVGSPRVCLLSTMASERFGFHGSDQLSLSGAFRSLTGGVVVLDIARRMERLCPNAWLLFHANPVAVYSGLVNNHTNVRALGMCGSAYSNHRWDLTRLLYEREESREDYAVTSAGVNHFSLMLRGRHHGEDVYGLLDRKYAGRPWKPKLRGVPASTVTVLHFAYSMMREMRRRFGVMSCSCELEGELHVFPEINYRPYYYGKGLPRSEKAVRDAVRLSQEHRDQSDREFRGHLDRDLSPEFWAQSQFEAPWFGAAPADTTAVAIRAVGTGQPTRLAASLPNRGAIRGFKDRAVVEFSLTFDGQRVQPDPDLEIPDCLHGLISSLSCHQTLLGDAVARHDPRLFAEALYAYPVRHDSRNAKALWRELLRIHADEIPAEFQEAKAYF
jgi:alpha-galactosidase/6-phospho-beta-glucosidase family protein